MDRTSPHGLGPSLGAQDLDSGLGPAVRLASVIIGCFGVLTLRDAFV